MLEPKISISITEKGKRSPNISLDADFEEMALKEILEFMRNALIVTADTVLKEEQNRGFDKKPFTVVDNVPNKSVLAVKPTGKIQFFNRIQDVGKIILEAYKLIYDRSRVRTGLYRDSHTVFLNGKRIADTYEDLQKWFVTNAGIVKEKDLFRIVNIQPYARKLELLGMSAGRARQKRSKNRDSSKIVTVPNGAYALAARAIKRKYKGLALINFKFLTGASMGLMSGVFKSSEVKFKKRGRTYLYPSISIGIQGGSLGE